MKNTLIMIILMFLSCSLFAASSGQTKINSSSWSLLYGFSQNVNNQNYKPAGPSYKFQFGQRWDNNIETNFFARYASQKDNINFSSTEGNISRKAFSGGISLGYWIFSALNIHAGYSFHHSYNKIVGTYTSSQITAIKSNYSLSDLSSKGLFAGADLVLLKGKSFQLFTNYSYYHINHADSHDWEAMVGMRFYPGPSKGGSSSSGSFFNKFFGWVLPKDGK